MSSEIKSIKRRKPVIRSLEQIIMLPGSQRTIIKSRTKERNNSITRMEKNTTNKTLGKKMMIENQERPESNLVIPVGYVQRPHMATSLNARTFRSTFQVNQEDQLVHLKKSA